MATLKKDLKDFLNDSELYALAESHLEAWKDRYYLKAKKDIRFDLQMNHDPSCEIDYIEDKLGRKLNDNENEYVVKRFNRKVLSLIGNIIRC